MPITNPWVRARNLENRYARNLRQVARQVGSIVEGLFAGGVRALSEPSALAAAKISLERYSRLLDPWAEATAGRLVEELNRQDKNVWRRNTGTLSRALRTELENAPTGAAMKKAMREQVVLITSLPTEAAARVHKLTLEGIENSSRASVVYKEIMRTGEVTEARANTIARTETSRTASLLVQARAEHVGSEGYIWRTSKDSDVRPSHKAMEGKFVRWDDAPTLDGMVGHAGCLPNCRCFPEPVIPEDF